MLQNVIPRVEGTSSWEIKGDTGEKEGLLPTY